MDAVHIPIFIAVGTSDTLTPPAMAQALLQRAHEPKQLYLSQGADHNDIMSNGVAVLEVRLSAYLQTIH
jgi:fermentation-respiration switch protein FrsA (DUF1100 family)